MKRNHMQEIEEEIRLAKSITPIESPVPAPPPPSPEGQFDTQTWGQINEKRQQRYDEYTRVIENIKEKYQDPQLADLFEAAYAQLDTYLNEYLELIGDKNTAQFKEDPGIFLDFGEKAKICRYPQARKYIITIPKEDVETKPRIWTSMAHELGHLVYWNSEFDINEEEKTARKKKHTLFSSEIVKTLGIKPDELDGLEYRLSSATKEQVLASMLLGWSEEIFADTFGAMVGGVVFAEQAKAAFLNDLAKLGKKRFETDIDHPYPLLRPYISATALENKSGKNTLWRSLKIKIATNAHLEEIFRDSLNSLSDPPGTVTDISDENLKVSIKIGENFIVLSLDEIKQALAKVIPIFVEKISSSKPLERRKNVWEFIEEFDDPQPTLIYRVIQGIGYWVNAVWG